MTAERRQCAGRVYVSDPYLGRHRDCEANATIEEAGKWYCVSHAPELRAKRNAARREQRGLKYQQRWAAQEAAYKRRRAEETACAALSTEALEAGAIAELVAAAEAVVDETPGQPLGEDVRTLLRAALVPFQEVTP